MNFCFFFFFSFIPKRLTLNGFISLLTFLAVILHKFNQALIEMASVEEAERVVNEVKSLLIRGRKIDIEFSKSQENNPTLIKQPISI